MPVGSRLDSLSVLPEGLDPRSWRGRFLAFYVHLIPLIFGSIVFIGMPWEGFEGNLLLLVGGGSLTAALVGVLTAERFWGFAYSLPGAFGVLAVTIGELLAPAAWMSLYIAVGAFYLLWVPSILIGLVILAVRSRRLRAGS